MITIPQDVTPPRDVLEHQRKPRSGTKYEPALRALDSALPDAWIPIDGVEDAGKFRAAIYQYARSKGKRVSVSSDYHGPRGGRLWVHYHGPRALKQD